jgi:PAS domain S-box-containing protein
MAPQVALSFVLIGASLAVLAMRRARRWQLLVFASLASLVLAVSLVALVGYALGIERSFGLDEFPRMSVQSAVTMLVLGITFSLGALISTRSRGGAVPGWLCIPVTAGAALFALLFAEALLAHQSDNYRRVVHAEAASINDEFASELAEQVTLVTRVARNWSQEGQTTHASWLTRRTNSFTDTPSLSAIEWIDGGYDQHWLVTRDGTASTDLGGDDDVARFRDVLVQARLSGETLLAGPFDHEGTAHTMVAVHPFQTPEGLTGWIVGSFDVGRLMAAALDDDRVDAYVVAIATRGQSIYSTSTAANPESINWIELEQRNVGGTQFLLRVSPRDSDGNVGRLPLFALAFGLASATLLGTSVFGLQSAGHRSRQLRHAYRDLANEMRERRRVMHALAAREARFRAVSEGSLDGFYFFQSVRDDGGATVDFELTEWNAVALQWLAAAGLEPTALRFSHMPPLALTAELVPRLATASATGQVIEREALVRSARGEDTWLHQQFVPLSNGFALMSRDISARRRAEDERNRLALLVESSNDAIVGKSLDGTVQSWNRGAEIVYGYTAQEMIGRTTSILLPPDRQNELDALLQRIRGGEHIESFETVRVRHDGSRIDVSLTVSPILDAAGAVVGASTIARDITERKWVEAMVHESATKFRAILDAAPDSVIISTADGRIMLVNREFELQFGYARTQIIGQRVDDFLPMPIPEVTEERKPALVNIDPIAQLLGPGVQVTAQRIDGSEFPVEIRLSTVEAGDATLFILVVRDVSERVRAERDLKASAAALARSNRELQEFAYVASHDLKAPLVSLRGMASLLVEDYGDHLDGDARLYADRIVFNADKMQALLDDLLEFSQVGHIDTDLRSLSLDSVVRGVIEQFEHTLTQRHARVEINGDMPTVRASRVRLSQVFSNLIDNGLTYTPPERAPSIRITSVDRGDHWEISVADNGCGIPVDYQSKIFGMFQRLPDGKAMNPGGTGMGLAIVARIIEAHGGRCWLDSTVGRGTTFYFTLAKDASRAADSIALVADG